MVHYVLSMDKLWIGWKVYYIQCCILDHLYVNIIEKKRAFVSTKKIAAIESEQHWDYGRIFSTHFQVIFFFFKGMQTSETSDMQKKLQPSDSRTGVWPMKANLIRKQLRNRNWR